MLEALSQHMTDTGNVEKATKQREGGEGKDSGGGNGPSVLTLWLTKRV
jgi:hypothetical protein